MAQLSKEEHDFAVRQAVHFSPCLKLHIRRTRHRPTAAHIKGSTKFADAVFPGDDGTSMSLLNRGQITIHTPWAKGPGRLSLGPWTLLSARLLARRERVAKEFLRRGVDIDEFERSMLAGTDSTPDDSSSDGNTASLAGFAIMYDHVEVL